MSGPTVQGPLPVESFGLLGVSECGVARWKILALLEVKGFMVHHQVYYEAKLKCFWVFMSYFDLIG